MVNILCVESASCLHLLWSPQIYLMLGRPFKPKVSRLCFPSSYFTINKDRCRPWPFVCDVSHDVSSVNRLRSSTISVLYFVSLLFFLFASRRRELYHGLKCYRSKEKNIETENALYDKYRNRSRFVLWQCVL